ncbi:acyltransferase family protein [Mucilaginibacter jinjuensis]|uniref:Acyltransferase n=1 Tax=Mucilaginibacter jinjuensis TaxID=1176721 RepID=A0ABY7T5C1_9SPHI|nr:acyltransferase [Mucilaginibacter jinjuensis]WCT10988.1 acyltransferase [Mucilaginibacter jinjuensis]
MNKKIYFENLDGLRFLCFLSVFFYHSFYTQFAYIEKDAVYQFIKHGIFGNGNLGVNFFFVLSGFLITTLLIEEKKLNGNIKIPFFWLRRILRIWPLFYAAVFIGFVIFPFLKRLTGQVPNETAHLVYYLTFTNNFDMIKNGLPDASILGVLWSVAVEEQFYFVWPIILYVFPINKLWIPFSVILISSLIFRALNHNYAMLENHTLSCIGDMVIGATGAWLIEISPRFKLTIQKLSKTKILLVYLVFAVIYFFRQQLLLANYGTMIFERLFIAIVIVTIIMEQTYASNSFFKMSSFKRMSKLGTITYGLYCLHFLGILIAINITKKLSINNKLWEVMIVDTSIALVTAIIISAISYKFYEAPFLKLKNKFAFITK